MSIAEEVLLPAQAARAAVRAELDLIDAAQARLRGIDTDLVGNAFRVEVAERLETQARVNRGLSYRAFAEIVDPVDGFDDPALPAGIAISDLLWKRLRVNRAEIRRRFRVAVRIRPRRSLTGPELPAQLPVVAGAVEDGAIGCEHITEITKALHRLPAKTTPAQYEHAERTLVQAAREQDPNFVATLGYAIADALNPDGDFSDEDRARRRTLTLHRQGFDGMSRLTGCVDPQTRAYLEAILAAVRPGHRQPGTPAERPDAPDTRSVGQRNHDGLKLALRHAIESAKLGTHRGVPLTVVVTTKLGDLERAFHAADNPMARMPAPARTGGGSRLPYRDLIAMAAGSIHYLAVFDDHSERPLYLGRSKRLATLDHRIICYARDHGCTRPNCPQPGYHCEIHHSPGWAQGGRTDADKLHFACGGDHGGTTDGHYTTVVTDTGRLGWTDGTGPPQINHLHHPDELLDNDRDDDDRDDDDHDDP